jgi:hypothetical protein
MSTGSTPGGAPPAPVITVTRGEPTPAELAAVLAVLLAGRSAAPDGPATEHERPSQWTQRSRARAAFPRPGPHAWRASALPH